MDKAHRFYTALSAHRTSSHTYCVQKCVQKCVHKTWHHVLWMFCCACMLLPTPDAHARSFYVRTLTVGRSTNFMRADQSVVAQRILTQGLTLHAFDLLNDFARSLDAQFTLRYATDLGLSQALRIHPAFAPRDNDFRIEIARITWTPSRWLQLRLGRQWSFDALGMSDFDGLKVRLGPRLGQGSRAWIEATVGRDARLKNSWLATTQADIQGIPIGSSSQRGQGTWISGARVGYALDPTVFVDLSYRRRWSTQVPLPQSTSLGTTLDSERIGASAAIAPWRSLNLNAHALYNTLLRAPDRLGVQAAWHTGWQDSTLNAGMERRHPWFDSSSIFNLFGANPHDGAFLTYQQPLFEKTAQLELRTWWRSYHGDQNTFDASLHKKDASALGGAINYNAKIRLERRLIRWSTHASYQHGNDDYGGKQILIDTSLRMPILRSEPFFLRARVLALYTYSGDPKPHEASALSALLGVDIPVLERGTLSILLEQQLHSERTMNTNLFANLEVEVWP